MNISKGTQKKFIVIKRSEIDDIDYSTLLMLIDRLNSTMNSQEFILIPKSFHTHKKNNSTLQVLKDPEVQ